MSLPADLVEAADAAVEAGAAPNFSRFVAEALRRELRRRHDDTLAGEARKLDASEETALARGARDGRQEPGGAPWQKLR